MSKLLPLFLLALAGCAGPHGVADWTGPLSNIPARVYIVAQDQEDWKKLWERVDRPVPKADLDANFGVGIFLGDKGPGEYKFAWNYRTLEGQTKILIGYKVFVRAAGIGPRTRPYAIFLFPRSIAHRGAEVLVEDQTPGGVENL